MFAHLFEKSWCDVSFYDPLMCVHKGIKSSTPADTSVSVWVIFIFWKLCLSCVLSYSCGLLLLYIQEKYIILFVLSWCIIIWWM